jgi:hypothetical protein
MTTLASNNTAIPSDMDAYPTISGKRPQTGKLIMPDDIMPENDIPCTPDKTAETQLSAAIATIMCNFSNIGNPWWISTRGWWIKNPEKPCQTGLSRFLAFNITTTLFFFYFIPPPLSISLSLYLSTPFFIGGGYLLY